MRAHGFCLQKTPPKMAFFRHFGVKNGPFLGGKVRIGGNTPKGVYYHQFGTFIGRFYAQKVRKPWQK